MNQATIEKAAKTLAEQFDYPWDHMPEQGRDNMRKIARMVIADAVAEERERCAQVAWREFADVCKKKGLNPCEKHNADWLVSAAIREGVNHAG